MNNSNICKNWLFPESPSAAIKIQKTMAEQVILEDFSTSFSTIAGMDVSNNRFDPSKMVYASAVTLSFPELNILEKVSHSERQDFPYISGLLGFREAPALIKAFAQLKQRPDLILVDGHGVSHPRGLGIASHLGVLLDIPTIGVAKSILVGSPLQTLGEEKGAQTPLVWKEKIIGMMVRSKLRSNPLIISAGHKVTLETAVKIVLNSLKGYRLSEPTRQAHLYANEIRCKRV